MALPMSDQVRVLIAQLCDGFKDHDGHHNPSLLALVGSQLRPVHMADHDSGHRKISGSPAPWGDLAGWWTDVHAGSRQWENRMMWLVSSRQQNRGGSNVNTVRALRNLATLTEAAEARFPQDPRPVAAVDACARWVSQARIALGVDKPWARVNGVPCPMCREQALRMRPADGTVVCFNPDCRDEHGRRYQWGRDEHDWLGRIISA